MNRRTCTTLRNNLLILLLTALPSLAQHVIVLNPPGSIYTTASALNNKGITVGSFEYAGQQLQGFAYLSSNNTYKSIQYPGADYTIALGVNDSNTVSGTFANSDGVNHGFFLQNGTFRQYDVPGFSGTTIIGINKAGDFAGTVGSDGNYQGFVSVGGVISTFVVDGQPTDGYGINSSGQSVGFFVNKELTGTHGFLRDSSGETTQIDYPGSLSTACTGINDSGVITGFYVDQSANNRGFVLVGGKFQTLGAPYIAGINNQNVVVGSGNSNSGETFGFIASR